MEIFELIKITLLGISLGIMTGMLPGIGIFTTVLMCFSIIKNFDAFSLVLFYVSLICSSQYVGSVVAIYLGVPGEQTALIACRYGYKIYQRDHAVGNLLISGTAVASLVGSLFAVALIILSFSFIAKSAIFFSVNMQLAFLLLIFIIILCSAGMKKIYLNFFLVSMGLLLGSIGFNQIGELTLTFGQGWLLPGLNYFLLILILFVIPNIIINLGAKKNNFKFVTPHLPSLITGVKITWKYIGTVLRGSFIGGIMGLIPGVGTSSCSMVAANIEEKIRKGCAPKVISAEAANNSAVLTSVIPLLLFGIPILPSEAIIMDLLSTKQAIIGPAWFRENLLLGLNYLETLLIFALICNLLMVFLACWGAAYLAKLYSLLTPRFIIILVIALTSFMVGYDSLKQLRWQLDLLTLAVLLPFMLVIIKKKIDTLPLVFSFLMVELFQKIIYYYIKIYVY